MTTNSDQVKDIHDYNVDINNRLIFLHNHTSSIDDSNAGVDHRMVATFIKNIQILDSASNNPILVHMHSVGGYLYDGMAIYDAIATCQSFVTIVAYGQAESMSSIILQAADKRIMMPNAYFMLHYGSTGYSGNYLDVHNYVDFEKNYNEKINQIYTSALYKSKFIKEKYQKPTIQKAYAYLLKQLHRGDWFLSADDAVHHGFADGVLGSKSYPNIGSLL